MCYLEMEQIGFHCSDTKLLAVGERENKERVTREGNKDSYKDEQTMLQ